MDSQPVTDERLRAVVAQFLDLARGDDDLALASEYLAGRIYQVHLFDADGRRAAEIYAALAARRPESPWAQLALVKLALLKLYVLPEPSTPAARVAEVETYFARLTDRALVRDLHLVVGRARLFHGLPDFLPHLVAAAEAGGLVGVPRADLQIQIGELSRRAGQLEQAQKYFEQFLAENEVDGRVYAVRVRLAEVLAARGGTKTPPPS
jgi:hypothetical protein